MKRCKLRVKENTRRNHGASAQDVIVELHKFATGWMSQNELVRIALNNRWLEEQGVPGMIAPAAVAALKQREA